MKCDCCGKRKCWLEAFEDIENKDETLHVCVKCSTLLYKIRYASKNGDIKEYDSSIASMKKRMLKASSGFKEWFKNNKALAKK